MTAWTALARHHYYALRVGTAAVVASGTAQLLGLSHPVYALIAAVLVSDVHPASTKRLATTRLVATLFGSICGGLACLAHLPAALAVGVVAGAIILTADQLSYFEGGKLAAYIAGIVLLDHADEPFRYAAERVVETALGIATAMTLAKLAVTLKGDKP